MPFQSTKTYGHEVGLSACFRQWRATSHCNQLHGYALAFSFVFEAQDLDHRNWVVDFGGLAYLKHKLATTFDHKLVVAQDDPMLDEISALGGLGVADVLVMDSVGCEQFAALAYTYAQDAINQMGIGDRVRVVSAECREHGANSAIYVGE